MRNFFGYAVISAVLKRKRLLICNSRKMAKTDLYNERKREGRREEGEIEKAACSAGAGANASGACARGLLSGTLSVILPYLMCQIAGLLFVV